MECWLFIKTCNDVNMSPAEEQVGFPRWSDVRNRNGPGASNENS